MQKNRGITIMSEAYRCNKCGQFRLSPETDDFDSPTRITWTTMNEVGKTKWHEIDLCEECRTSVIDLLTEIEKTNNEE